MSVVSMKEIHTGRGGSDETSGGRSVKNDKRVFRAMTNNPLDNSLTVLASAAQLGTVHPNYPYLYLIRRRADNEQFSKKVWIVTLEYSSDIENSENPLYELPVITWDTESSQQAFFVDKDGDAILNSAGDYYEEGVNDEVNDWSVKIEKKLAAIPTWILSCKDAINSSAFNLDGIYIDQYQAKISGINIGWWEQKNDTWYRQITFTIKLKEEGWIKTALDQGLHRIVSTKKVMCVNDDGTEVTKPVLLDGSGGQLASPTPSTAVFNEYHIRPEQNFNSLLYFLYESYS